MKMTALRVVFGISLLAAAAACEASTPPLPTEPRNPEEPKPPNTGFRTVAAPAIYA